MASCLRRGKSSRRTFSIISRLSHQNYGERYRNGERISTGFGEATVNQVVSKRMVKKQQMRWARNLLQVRTKVIDGDWHQTFERWDLELATQSA